MQAAGMDEPDVEEADPQLTVGEMAQLLLHAVKQCGPDSPECGTFLDNFSEDNDNFVPCIDDVFVAAVTRQSPELTIALLNKYGNSESLYTIQKTVVCI